MMNEKSQSASDSTRPKIGEPCKDDQRTSGEPSADFNVQLAQLKEQLNDVAETVSEAASSGFHDVQHAVQHSSSDAMATVKRQVRRDPMTTMAVAAGIGLLLGAMIAR